MHGCGCRYMLPRPHLFSYSIILAIQACAQLAILLEQSLVEHPAKRFQPTVTGPLVMLFRPPTVTVTSQRLVQDMAGLSDCSVANSTMNCQVACVNVLHHYLQVQRRRARQCVTFALQVWNLITLQFLLRRDGHWLQLSRALAGVTRDLLVGFASTMAQSLKESAALGKISICFAPNICEYV